MPDNDYQDDQAQSETFDETHIDDDGDGDLLLDETDQVLDVTQADGDADEDDFDEDDIDLDDQMALDGIEREADAILGADAARVSQSDVDGAPQEAPDEVELVYTGLMRNVRGARPAPPTGRPSACRTTISPTWAMAPTTTLTTPLTELLKERTP